MLRAPKTWKTGTAGFWLAAPGVAVVLALGEVWVLIGMTAGVLLIGAAAGAWAGARWRSKRTSA